MFQSECECLPSEVDALEHYFYVLGSVAISVVPKKGRVVLRALFNNRVEVSELLNVRWTQLDASNWMGQDSQVISGMTVTVPTTVFGPTHPTSRLCQEAMYSRYLECASWGHVIDVGTGSGVLSLLAWQQGCRSLEAIDYDPQAIQIAKENAAKNGISESFFEVRDLFEWSPKKKASCVIANLPTEILLPAWERLLSWKEPSGVLILSGFMAQSLPTLLPLFESRKIVERTELESWLCFKVQ